MERRFPLRAGAGIGAGGSTTRFETAWTYEADRDLVNAVTNTWYDSGGANPVTVSQHEYGFNARAQRTHHQRSGDGVSPSFCEAYGYNDRGELTSAEYHAAVYPATNHVSASDHGFAYDPIGNRRQATQPLAGFSPEYYCTNALNQILTIDDADTCPPGSPNRSFTYDADGNMTGDGDLALVYDAENRLVEVAPASPGSGDKKQVFVYDYRNRRVQVTVYQHDGSAWGGTPVAQSRFVWDGWLLIAELDGLDDNAPLRRWTWGLDLAGQRGGRPGDAAGIGGLLAVDDATVGGTAEYVYAFDAHGNVTDVVDLAPTTWGGGVRQARYDYTPYGALRSHAGTYALANKFRFSTKTWDDESGLGYWGERFYHPEYGRWVNRDPIGEGGGSNLYGYAANAAILRTDGIGLTACTSDDKPKRKPPTTQPSDDEICSSPEAQKLIDKAAEGTGAHGVGTVICYNGRKIACGRTPDVGGKPPDDVKEQLRDCVKAHERRHLPDTEECPKDGMSLPYRKHKDDSTIQREQECYAYCVEARCLRDMYRSCKTQECRDAASARVKQIKEEVRENCRSLRAQQDPPAEPECPPDPQPATRPS